jgi:hypothetical protein
VGLQQGAHDSDSNLMSTVTVPAVSPVVAGTAGGHGRGGQRRSRVAVAMVGTILLAAGCTTSPSAGGPSPLGVWTRGVTPAITNQSMDSISCPSASFCAAVGAPTDTSGTGYGWTFHAGSWSAPVAVDPTAALVAVSCASASFCVAPDLNAGFTTFNGSSWSPLEPLDPDGVPVAISCPSVTFCMAVGQESVSTSSVVSFDAASWVFNGSTWSAPMFVASSAFLSSVSCPSSTYCVAVGGDETNNGAGPPGLAVTYDGSGWHRPVAVDHSLTLGSVSCRSRDFCVAGSGSPSNPVGRGYVLTFDGSRWSPALKVDSQPFNNDSLSCPTTSFCMVADVRGDVVIFNGSSWSAPSNGLGASSLLTLTCRSAAFCLAVNTGTKVFQWRRAHG